MVTPDGARRSRRVGCFTPPLPRRGRRTSRQQCSKHKAPTTDDKLSNKKECSWSQRFSKRICLREAVLLLCCWSQVTFRQDDFPSSGNVVAMLLGPTFHQGDLSSPGDVTAMLPGKVSSLALVIVRRCCLHSFTKGDVRRCCWNRSSSRGLVFRPAMLLCCCWGQPL